MTELSYAAKTKLVTYLAQFSGPSEAARLVSEEFAVTVDRRTAWKYDASKRGCKLGSVYRQLFWEVRERWLNDLAALPIAHRGHRLRLLDRLVTKLESEGEYGGALRAIELAAKEVGGVFDKGHGQNMPKSVATVATDAASAKRELVDRLNALLGRGALSPLGRGQYPPN